MIANLVVIYTDEKILLGMKKRGFGMGRWNGFGGKVLEGETAMQAAHRELKEEVGLDAEELIARGKLVFTFEKDFDENENLEVYLFATQTYKGEPIETDEMKPQWFLHSEIPYDEMWADDKYWLPEFLQGKNIRGGMHFDSPGSQVILKNNIESYEN